MKDYTFFPAAAILAGLMVLAAMRADPRSLPTGPMSVGAGDRSIVMVEGANLNRFKETKRSTATLVRAQGQPAIIRLTSRRAADFPADAQDVTYLPLATDLEVAFSQKPLRVTLRARSAEKNGSPIMRVEYSAGSEGNSDWRQFLMTPQWQDYTFTYTPPASDANLGLDFLGIWADPDGLGRGVEVSQIVFDVRG